MQKETYILHTCYYDSDIICIYKGAKPFGNRGPGGGGVHVECLTFFMQSHTYVKEGICLCEGMVGLFENIWQVFPI